VPFAPVTVPFGAVTVPFAPITSVPSPLATSGSMLSPFAPIASVLSPFTPISGIAPILRDGIQVVGTDVHGRSLGRRDHSATRTPVVSRPVAPAPVQAPPAEPVSAGGAAAGAGSSSAFFFAGALLLAALALEFPRLFGRIRLLSGLLPPSPFALLIAEPG
jgi:hypothetical protein